MSDVPVEVQAHIIQQKIQIWLNTEYDAQLDAEIAQVLSDDQMKAAAVLRMKNAKKAIAELTRKLSALGDVAAEVE